MANPQINSSQAIVDDRDPRITYNGDWFLNGVSQEYNTSEHGTTSKGATAQFSFNGTSVAVYGTVAITGPSGLSVSTFTLDNNSLVTYTSQNTSSTQFQTQYYQSGLLNDGEHKLTITNVSPAYFWIDYILYSPSTGTGNSGSVSGGKARTNIGAITGGVAGGMVLLTAVLLFYIVCYRRRRRGVFYEYRSIYPKDILGAETSESPQTARPPNIAPFNIIPLEDRVSPEAAGNIDLPATHGSSLTASEQTTVAAGVHSFEHSQIPLPSTATTAPDNSSQTRRPLRKGARPLPPSTISAPRLHEDGGVRLQGGPAADPENLTDIPPVYRPY